MQNDIKKSIWKVINTKKYLEKNLVPKIKTSKWKMNKKFVEWKIWIQKSNNPR